MYLASPKLGVAWVTGASSGIGRAVALALARDGYSVAATSDAADELATLLQERVAPGAIHVFPGDITDAPAMGDLVGRIESLAGPIALAFLNAGGQWVEERARFDQAIFERTMRLNLLGTANCLAPLLARMRGRRAGQIAINGSSSGYGGLPQAISYGASKAALIHLSESLRLACAADGITIQLVSLGFVRTALTDMNRFPMPFRISPEQAARRICAGFRRTRFEIVTPRRLVWLVKLANLLPYRLYFRLVAAVSKSKRIAT